MRTAASLVLRGANDFMCDEMERSIHDALCVVKRVLESKSVVPGGGAVEAALSIYLENFASSLVSYLTPLNTPSFSVIVHNGEHVQQLFLSTAEAVVTGTSNCANWVGGLLFCQPNFTLISIVNPISH